MATVVRLSPLDPYVTSIQNGTASFACLRLGHYEQAIRWGEAGMQTLQSATWSCAMAAAANIALGNVDRAKQIVGELLYHHSDLRLHEHHTDTGGVSDHVFALCQLLGFRFAPRIRDLKDRRLYAFESGSMYPGFAPLVASRLNERPIREQWPEILRLV